MIDPTMFTVKALLAELLAGPGGRQTWRSDAEIVVDDRRGRILVCYDGRFLRHSCGPRQGHFWDVYGDDYLTPSLAFLALMNAPVPPGVVA